MGVFSGERCTGVIGRDGGRFIVAGIRGRECRCMDDNPELRTDPTLEEERGRFSDEGVVSTYDSSSERLGPAESLDVREGFAALDVLDALPLEGGEPDGVEMVLWVERIPCTILCRLPIVDRVSLVGSAVLFLKDDGTSLGAECVPKW